MKERKEAGTSFYSIRVVREATGLTERRIRYYETLKMLVPRRTQGNQRLYTEEDIERLKYIKKLLDNGISLREAKLQLKQEDHWQDGMMQEPVERDADVYFHAKMLTRQHHAHHDSLYPLKDRDMLLKKIRRSDSVQSFEEE
ncbi:MAG: helix-turn-helix domain-containing protein [Firmicutes bacterium]|nr:helix-turn-helix domain-containing protein [Bacillota bacterium]